MIRPVAAMAALWLLAGCTGTSGAAASCAGPALTVTPTSVATGTDVHVTGQAFLDDCYDGGEPGTPPATQDVELELVTAGEASRTFALTTVDARADGTIDVTVRVPDDVPPGPARIEGGFSRPVDVVVTAP